ncbi:MAG: hypothetical protein K0R65_2923 [Crocinitomicaceae bacterium]|jgi:hypothetical protein|nr:hypothetical protein [Crocinitomicaceae bacterium]
MKNEEPKIENPEDYPNHSQFFILNSQFNSVIL